MNVFVVLDDLNKCPVKTTPAMPLKTVLDTACTKFNLDPNCYGLRFNRKMLDLSIPIRFTNLMAGAKLELVKMNDSSNTCSDVSGVTSGVKPVMINIALQVEDCRITGQYPSTTTLWQILRGAETSNASSSQG